MKNLLATIAAAALLAAVPLAARAGVQEGIDFLSTSELKRVYEKGDFVLINTLSPIEFKEKRIAGSINVPLSHYASGKVSLPEDKGTRLVFYCLGEK